MLLITELLNDTVEIVAEDTEGKKQLFVQGVYMQSAVTNRNGRMYPTAILEAAVNKYVNEMVVTNRALGELNHPASPVVNAERASHRIVELARDGLDFVGKSLVLNTPMGNLVRGLIEGGTRIGMSSRALGTVKRMNSGILEIQDDLMLSTVDVVTDPSAPKAFVDGIMEGCEYYLNESGILSERKVDDIQRLIRGTKSVDLPKTSVQIFREVMESTFK